jgi:hypothetical protein
MFVRFVVAQAHQDTDEPMGIFEAVDLLPRVGQLADWDERRLTELRDWFRAHLPFPDRTTRSTRPNATHRALSWFKASATEHITHARELAAVLEAYDIRTQMLTAERPGYIVYEDEIQVLAEPFRGERSGRGV